MRDLYKNPIFYYVLVPILAGLWPLLVRGVLPPGMQGKTGIPMEAYWSAESPRWGGTAAGWVVMWLS